MKRSQVEARISYFEQLQDELQEVKDRLDAEEKYAESGTIFSQIIDLGTQILDATYDLIDAEDDREEEAATTDVVSVEPAIASVSQFGVVLEVKVDMKPYWETFFSLE